MIDFFILECCLYREASALYLVPVGVSDKQPHSVFDDGRSSPWYDTIRYATYTCRGITTGFFSYLNTAVLSMPTWYCCCKHGQRYQTVVWNYCHCIPLHLLRFFFCVSRWFFIGANRAYCGMRVVGDLNCHPAEVPNLCCYNFGYPWHTTLTFFGWTRDFILLSLYLDYMERYYGLGLSFASA